MKKSLRTFAFAATCIVTTAVFAETGTVGSIGSGPYYDGICGKSCALIQIKPHTYATCANTGLPWGYALDTSTVAGRNTLSLLIAAQTTGKTVVISGYGTCNLYSGVEDLKLMYQQ